MNDCGAKSKLSAPLIYLSKTGNYSYPHEFVYGVTRLSSGAPASVHQGPTGAGPLFYVWCQSRGIWPEVFFVYSAILGNNEAHDT